MAHEQSKTTSVTPSTELSEHTVRLHAKKGEAARHGEVKGRIEAAMEPVDRIYDTWLNELITINPTATDEQLAAEVTGAVNAHQAPAIFAATGAYIGPNTTRAYTSIRMTPDQQFLTPQSLRVTRELNEDTDYMNPFKFKVELDFPNFKMVGAPHDEDSFATAIFTDFDSYGDQAVPDFLYDGDQSHGEGGWKANADLLEGLVAQQLDHVDISKDWYKQAGQ